MPEGGATGSGSKEAAPTTRGGTTASATLTSLTGLGLTTMLLTNFPVRKSGRTTLVTRCGISGPLANNALAAKPAIISLKQNRRKMFPIMLSLKSQRPRGTAGYSDPDASLMLSFPCDVLGVRAGRGAQFPDGA